MSWILALVYCGMLWLIFAKLKLLKFSLPLAIVAASVGPTLIVTLLLCAQYLHPYTANARSYQEVIPIVPQLRQAGRVIEIAVEPNVPVQQGDVLFRIDPVPYQNSVARLAASLEEALQSEQVAVASVDLAKATLTRADANLEFATRNRSRIEELVKTNSVSQEELDQAVNRFAEADAAVNQAKASLTQAQLSIELSRAKIEQVTTQLADAKYDLEQTTVVAPGDGFVVNLALREGMLVGGTGTGSVMSFVLERSELTQGIIVAAFNQKNFLRIKQGQYAEVALFGYPGQIFTGHVVNTIPINGEGQLTASGIIPISLGNPQAAQFVARIKLDRGDVLHIPGGSQALVAVYTEDVQIAGIPVMFLIRAQSWIRYIL